MVKTWKRHKNNETALNNCWRLVAVGRSWWLAVSGWWQLAVGGGWRLAVGGWRSWGLPLTKEKTGVLKDSLAIQQVHPGQIY